MKHNVMNLISHSNKLQWTEEELKDCFYVFDSDGNGFIDMDELHTACKMLGCDDKEAEKLSQVKSLGFTGISMGMTIS